MNKTFKRTLSILFVAGLSLGMSSPEPVVKNEHKHAGHKQSTGGYVKPHAGIVMRGDFPGVMQVGEPVNMSLTFQLDISADQLLIDVRSLSEGLQVSQQSFSFTTVQQAEVSLQLSALAEGVHTLEINTRLTRSGQTQARSFVQRIRVGDIEEAKSAEIESSKPGYAVKPEQGVISMPAVETTE